MCAGAYLSVRLYARCRIFGCARSIGRALHAHTGRHGPAALRGVRASRPRLPILRRGAHPHFALEICLPAARPVECNLIFSFQEPQMIPVSRPILSSTGFWTECGYVRTAAIRAQAIYGTLLATGHRPALRHLPAQAGQGGAGRGCAGCALPLRRGRRGPRSHWRSAYCAARLRSRTALGHAAHSTRRWHTTINRG